MTRPVTNIDTDDLIERYRAGASQNSLAKMHGVDRCVIRRLLSRAGLGIRSCADANRIEQGRRTPEQRQRFTQAAHDAIRGKKRSPEELRKRALAHSRICGLFEAEVIERLGECGIDAEHQFPVDRYNLDVALVTDAVAVEIFASHPRRSETARYIERIEYLLDSGWSVLVVISRYPNRDFDVVAVCNEVIAFRDFSHAHESAAGHYRVIRGSGKAPTRTSFEIDHRTRV